MNNPIKLGVYLLLIIVFGFVALKLIFNALSFVFSLLVPILFVGALGLIIYGIVRSKALGGGGRSLR